MKCMEFMGEQVRVIMCQIGYGIIGIPFGIGPQIEAQEDGRDVVVDTLLIREAMSDDGHTETIALIIGKNCQDKIEQIIAMANEKMTLPGCTMARVGRIDEGWKVAGWRTARSSERDLRPRASCAGKRGNLRRRSR